jgi:hypothetical protein
VPHIRHSDRLGAATWLLASILLLCWPFARLISTAGQFRLRPNTPIDLTNAEYAVQWRFLITAKRHIPPGASLTIIGPNRDDEATLFFMSLGVFPSQLTLPWSYGNRPRPSFRQQADYLLAYRVDPGSSSNLQRVAAVEHGAVYRNLEPHR